MLLKKFTIDLGWEWLEYEAFQVCSMEIINNGTTWNDSRSPGGFPDSSKLK